MPQSDDQTRSIGRHPYRRTTVGGWFLNWAIPILIGASLATITFIHNFSDSAPYPRHPPVLRLPVILGGAIMACTMLVVGIRFELSGRRHQGLLVQRIGVAIFLVALCLLLITGFKPTWFWPF